jgi:hypothetical protein
MKATREEAMKATGDEAMKATGEEGVSSSCLIDGRTRRTPTESLFLFINSLATHKHISSFVISIVL